MKTNIADIVIDDKMRNELQSSGLEGAYLSFRKKVEERVKAGKIGFAEQEDGSGYIELIAIRDAEEKFYRAMEGKYEREKESAVQIRAKYQPFVQEYLQIQDPFSRAAVDSARQVIGENIPSEGKINFTEYAYDFNDQAPELGCAAKQTQSFIEAVEYTLAEVLGSDRLQSLKFDPAAIPSLRAKELQRACAYTNWKRRETSIDTVALDIFVNSDFKKTPEDIKSVVEIWLGKIDQKEQGQNKSKQSTKFRNEGLAGEEEHNTQPDNTWQKRMGYGAAGAALMVVPALLPQDKEDNGKLTFAKVLKTTAAVLLPLVGVVLLSRAMMPGGFAERIQNETRTQGTGFGKN